MCITRDFDYLPKQRTCVFVHYKLDHYNVLYSDIIEDMKLYKLMNWNKILLSPWNPQPHPITPQSSRSKSFLVGLATYPQEFALVRQQLRSVRRA